jgi:hypothetical protein
MKETALALRLLTSVGLGAFAIGAYATGHDGAAMAALVLAIIFVPLE